jgi:argininosuccinate lyase
MQLPLFSAVEQVREMLSMLTKFTAALRFRQDRMRAACETGFLNAMAAATYLTRRGIPFRTAHGFVGQAVRLGLERGCELGDLPLKDLQALNPAFQQDFYEAVTLRATLDCHDVIGGTAVHRVKQALAAAEERVLALAGESHACA